MEQLKPNKVVTSGPLDENTGQRAAFPGITPRSKGTSYRSGFSVPLDVNDYLASVIAEAHSRSPVASVRQPKPSVPKGRRALRSYNDDDDGIVVTSKRLKTGGNSHVEAKCELSDASPIHASVTLLVGDRPPSVKIDSQWRLHFLQRFNRYRIEYEKAVIRYGKVDSSGSISQVIDADLMAKEEDEGPDVSDQQQAENEELPQADSLHGARAWRRFLVNSEPSMDRLTSISFADTVRILHYYRKWVTLSMHAQLSHWLLFLLVKLPAILQGDDIAILRELARRCMRLLAKPESDTSLLSTSSVFILKAVVVIVTDYYHQLDLLEPLAL